MWRYRKFRSSNKPRKSSIELVSVENIFAQRKDRLIGTEGSLNQQQREECRRKIDEEKLMMAAIIVQRSTEQHPGELHHQTCLWTDYLNNNTVKQFRDKRGARERGEENKTRIGNKNIYYYIQKININYLREIKYMNNGIKFTQL